MRSILLGYLSTFVRQIDVTSNYDYLVSVDRKGIALIRLLLENYKEDDLKLHVSQIISDVGILSMPKEQIAGKRILLFDDSLFKGELIEKKKRQIENLFQSPVDTAAFLVFENCPFRPTYSFFNSLPMREYVERRTDLALFLAESEKLLLDTEHLAIRFRTDLPKAVFLERIRALDDVLVVPRPWSTDRLFVSIQHPRFFDYSIFKKWPKLWTQGMVFKNRFIIEDEYCWLIPVPYPGVASDQTRVDCPTASVAPSVCICPEIPGSSILPFYCVSFFFAVKLIASCVKALEDSGVKVDLFRSDCETKFPVENLHAMFPSLDVNKLKEWCRQEVNKALAHSTPTPKRAQFKLFDDSASLRKAASEVLLILANHRDKLEAKVERGEILPEDEEHTGLPHSDLYKSSKRDDQLETSRALDALIDQSLVAAMPVQVSIAGKEYHVRGVRLEGEYTHTLVKLALLEYERETTRSLISL